jgi:hypothetical protein
MHSSHLLRAFGWIGLAIGLGLIAIGALGGDLADLERGYGVLVIATAGYLLAGLWLRDLVRGRRSAHSTLTTSSGAGTGS